METTVAVHGYISDRTKEPHELLDLDKQYIKLVVGNRWRSKLEWDLESEYHQAVIVMPELIIVP